MQFSEANFIWIAYLSAAIGGFFIFADFGLNEVVAAAGNFRAYAVGNVVLQVPCVACMIWAAAESWPSKAHLSYFQRKRQQRSVKDRASMSEDSPTNADTTDAQN